MSSSARRLPVASTIDRVLWPATPDPAKPDAVRFPLASPGERPATTLPLREPHLPSNFVERVAAAEAAAFARGRVEGQAAAQEAANARVEALVERLGASIEALRGFRHEILRRAEQDLVRLALAMAEHIVRREIEQDRGQLIAIARAAIERLGGVTAATIRLHPADLDVIRHAHPEALAGAAVEVLADPQLPRGGCVIKSATGVIDAGIDAQLRELRRGIAGEAPPTDAPDAGHDEPDRR
jgi:flagellar biosynthesis/type III secretory pathway protein FliH